MKKVQTNNNEIHEECYWCADNVGRIALWGNIGLFGVKILCGIAGDSKALLADAVHSAADVLTALVIMICLHISKSPPDEDHPYGHGGTEYVASLFIGITLAAVVVLILYESILDIITGSSQQPETIALVGLLVSIAGNELMFRHSYCCGSQFGSPAMIANAWENRADVYSSLAALVGVVGAQLGIAFMDSVGAILVAILIGKSSFNMLRDSWKGILDSNLDDSVEMRVTNVAKDSDGVLGISKLKTRNMGPYLSIDLIIAVSPDISLWQAYDISDRVKKNIIKDIETDKTVGIINVGATGFYGEPIM